MAPGGGDGGGGGEEGGEEGEDSHGWLGAGGGDWRAGGGGKEDNESLSALCQAMRHLTTFHAGVSLHVYTYTCSLNGLEKQTTQKKKGLRCASLMLPHSLKGILNQ